ncbi:MAG: hypothetical protein Q9183_006230, partial [Haloplaca sp. 2 TL-2023]
MNINSIMAPSMGSTPSSESASAAGDSNYSPRKRMRKGTHSCLECRRRKIRCNFEPGAENCARCTTKGLECTEQEYGDAKALGADKRKTMRQRTTELEGMISQILVKLDHGGEDSGGLGGGKELPKDAETKAAEALRSLRTELLPSTTMGADVLAQTSTGLASPTSEKSDNTAEESSRYFHNPPLLSLFDNSVLSTGKDQQDGHAQQVGHISQASSTDKNQRVLAALKPLIPTMNDIGFILRASNQGLALWQEAMRGDC